MNIKQLYFTALMFICLCGFSIANNEILVTDMDSFKKATTDQKPGDKVILANGIWKDAELTFIGDGKAEMPIILTVQEKGMVFLEGQSTLRIAGINKKFRI